MCGRFSQGTPAEILAQLFQLADIPAWTPRYNIAPTQLVPTVVVTSEHPSRQFRTWRWGLIPSWAKDPSIGSRMINAQAETASVKPSFRAAFRRRRCLVLADGFYEWQQLGRRKQPFHVRMRDGSPFAFAGLWEHWKGPDGAAIDSCTLLTTEPNDLIRTFHHRMPVILDPQEYDLWLDPSIQEPDRLHPLLRPYTSEELAAYPISTRVNNPANDTPDCIQPLE
ncbi:MAG: SOS response-associated peptidase [candidate division NC10 bacterium]